MSVRGGSSSAAISFAFDVPRLRILVATAQEQHQLPVPDRIIEPVAGAGVDPQFADAIANTRMVTEFVERDDPGNPAKDRPLSDRIAQCLQPFHERRCFDNLHGMSLINDNSHSCQLEATRP